MSAGTGFVVDVVESNLSQITQTRLSMRELMSCQSCDRSIVHVRACAAQNGMKLHSLQAILNGQPMTTPLLLCVQLVRPKSKPGHWAQVHGAIVQYECRGDGQGAGTSTAVRHPA